PPEARLLDDLNLDSIKAGEWVAAAARHFGVEGRLDSSKFANASLLEVAAAIAQAGPAVAHVAPRVPAAPAVDIMAILVEVVAAKTGFASSKLPPEARLLDDLNLDSIKAGELIGEVAGRCGAVGALDASRLANASLREVTDAIAQVAQARAVPGEATPRASAPGAASAPVAGPQAGPSRLLDGWVRDFAVDYVPEPAPPPEGDWRGVHVACVADEGDTQLSQSLAQVLGGAGARVLQLPWGRIRELEADEGGGDAHVVAFLPRSQGAVADGQLAAQVQRLVDLAQATRKRTGLRLTIVHAASGVLPGQGDVNPWLGGAGPWAKSLFMERSGMRLCLVAAPAQVSAKQFAPLLAGELAGAYAWREVAYDRHMRRHVPRARVLHSHAVTPRNIAWQRDDVVLVTGGAKGITAACALALAQRHGLQLALVGSSTLKAGDEVSATLKRCEAEGVKARYYVCDMGDASAVRALVEKVRQTQGAPRAVVHGAGRNSIRMAQDMDVSAALGEMAPKVMGARHLLSALQDQPPALVVGLTSIIGVTGMPGNAWYAFANAVLDLLLARFYLDHPGTQVASLAYSVWDEVGMGARMGSVKKLGTMGIEAIPMADGVHHFMACFDGDCGVRQPVITARPGKLPTWPSAPLAPLQQGRFVVEELWGLPGVELTARDRLTTARDTYVLEHNFHGSLLFPTVFGLEAMAQVATVLTGGQSVVRIEDIRLERPIVVHETHGTRIDVCAAIDTDATTAEVTAVRCEIRCESSGFRQAHFAARLFLADAVGRLAAGDREVVFEGIPLPIQPKTDLYGGVLFQGERFHKIASVNAYTEGDLIVVSDSSFAAHGDDVWILGDPYLRDAQLQSMQLMAPRDEQLPVFIGRIDLGLGYDTAGKRVIHTVYRKLEDKTHFGEVTVQDGDGQVVERLTDYRLRILSHDPARPDMRTLLAPKVADDHVV
ncbi:MAG TPA: SDR family NAD(P)-dependent oxidoreductase, partial [Myxococcota bacterium]|nr:SDR family NAD(P)-dependent oxidoreductase [Myxococcota bacterium]